MIIKEYLIELSKSLNDYDDNNKFVRYTQLQLFSYIKEAIASIYDFFKNDFSYILIHKCQQGSYQEVKNNIDIIDIISEVDKDGNFKNEIKKDVIDRNIRWDNDDTLIIEDNTYSIEYYRWERGSKNFYIYPPIPAPKTYIPKKSKNALKLDKVLNNPALTKKELYSILKDKVAIQMLADAGNNIIKKQEIGVEYPCNDDKFDLSIFNDDKDYKIVDKPIRHEIGLSPLEYYKNEEKPLPIEPEPEPITEEPLDIYVKIKCSKIPDLNNINQKLDIKQEFIPLVTQFVLFRALSIDESSVSSLQQANNHFQVFITLRDRLFLQKNLNNLGVGDKPEITSQLLQQLKVNDDKYTHNTLQ